MKTPEIVVLMADGFEEIEAVAAIDILRRADLNVTVASIAGADAVTGAHALRLAVDTDLALLSADDFDMVVLPGGMPGSELLAASSAVRDFLREMARKDRFVCAICAAPIALAAADLSLGRTMTCYPGFETRLTGATVTGARVQVDGRMITANGPGAALDFAYELVAQLGGRRTAEHLAGAMMAF